ncbi:MAG: dihydrodipicolinate synthase family protein [Acidobacteria bacterium]|nr:MAG: dihydrodipicolinate synthase family protein [Acidobacteriota bacterium]
MAVSEEVRAALRRGLVIPAHPLALTAERRLDERRQTALTRYYCDAGAGGVAVGVHTTQFAIREPKVGLLEPVLRLAMDAVRAHRERTGTRLVTVAGVCGPTPQAVAEAKLARALGYDLGLLSLGALRAAGNDELLAHCRRVAEVIPLFGFYLQPAVGGRILDYRFWRALLEVEAVAAIKVAAFNRYQTLDVTRAVADSGRAGDVALYTGNDDAIVPDLLTTFPAGVQFAGGLLGQWAVWTSKAVEVLARAREARRTGTGVAGLLDEGAQLTDANAAIFDAANGFAGCIPGIHEVLRGQGLLAGRWCLDPHEDLSPGQLDEIARVRAAYPQLADDAFVAENRDRWLA